jgi:hypothetical protein
MQSIGTVLFLTAMVAGSPDFSAECLAQLKLDAVPTAPTSLFLYRRCLNTKKAVSDTSIFVERRLQRVDRYFLQDKKVKVEKGVIGKHTQQSEMSKVEAVQRARRQVRLQVRRLQQERNAKGEE